MILSVDDRNWIKESIYGLSSQIISAIYLLVMLLTILPCTVEMTLEGRPNVIELYKTELLALSHCHIYSVILLSYCFYRRVEIAK